tara:strand:- start:325 stop:981 length:657 start_codon:yes stop_codon:yes gene_type:complete
MNLTKINYTNDFNDLNIIDYKLKEWINKNKSKFGIICLDYRNRVRSDNLIPFLFCKKIVFKYINSFQQNNKILKKKIRCYVNEIIKNKKNITCIGGESYLYAIINNINYNFYTNSVLLLNEAEINNKIYKLNNDLHIIDYNKMTNIKIYDIILINLSKLNKNLIKIINNYKNKLLIIISCKHKDFWKKIKYLTNYKIISRKYFVCQYFITINILNFIS